MRKWLPLFAASIGTFMLLIDVTIVNVALPDIARDLDAGLSGLQWVVDGYALALAALLLVLGSLADMVGAKYAYLAGLVVFAVASFACGVADSVPLLVAARALQGVGGAAMFATTLSLLNATYTGRDRGVAFGVWGAVSGAAAGVGVVLGGVLTQLISWRWIFFVNLPIAGVAIALSAAVFAQSSRKHKLSVDLPGMFAFAFAASATTFGVIRGGEQGWGATSTVASLLLGALALAAFVAIEIRTTAPMLPMGLLRNRDFSATLVGALGQSFAAFASFPLISLWLQDQRGMTPIQTGLVLLPLSATAFLVAGAFGRFLHDVHPKLTIGASLVAIGIGTGMLAIVGAGSSWGAAIPGLVVIGLGVGVGAPALVSTALAAVHPRQGGIAAGAVNTARQLGLALGVAVLGTVFRETGGAGQTLTLPQFVDGLDAAFGVAGAVGIGLGLVAVMLFHRGDQLPEPAAVEQKAETLAG